MRWLLLLFWGGIAAARPMPAVSALDNALLQLEARYPFARQLGGGLSVLNGAVTGIGGFLLTLDGQRPSDEGLVGLAATALGTVIGIDGLIRLFGRSPAEMRLPHYRKFGPGKPQEYGGELDKAAFGQWALKELAEDAKRARRLRGLLDIGASGTYFYLYQKREGGKPVYRSLLYPGLAIAAIGLYRIFFLSAEEKAWRSYQEGVGQRSAEVELWTWLNPYPVVGLRLTY